MTDTERRTMMAVMKHMSAFVQAMYADGASEGLLFNSLIGAAANSLSNLTPTQQAECAAAIKRDIEIAPPALQIEDKLYGLHTWLNDALHSTQEKN